MTVSSQVSRPLGDQHACLAHLRRVDVSLRGHLGLRCTLLSRRPRQGCKRLHFGVGIAVSTETALSTRNECEFTTYFAVSYIVGLRSRWQLIELFWPQLHRMAGYLHPEKIHAQYPYLLLCFLQFL